MRKRKALFNNDFIKEGDISPISAEEYFRHFSKEKIERMEKEMEKFEDNGGTFILVDILKALRFELCRLVPIRRSGAPLIAGYEIHIVPKTDGKRPGDGDGK